MLFNVIDMLLIDRGDNQSTVQVSRSLHDTERMREYSCGMLIYPDRIELL